MKQFIEGLGRETAVTVLEFAILAPVIIFLIMAIMEGGRIFSTWVIITNEVREGARYGSARYCDPVVPPCDPNLAGTVQVRVKSRIGSMVRADPSRLAVTVQLNQGTSPSLAVTADYKVDIVTPLIQNLVPNPFPLRAVSVMRAEK